LEAATYCAQNRLNIVFILTLGDLGVEEDRSLLEAYAVSDDPRIQRIARHSLQKLSKE
jgi:hypothetical protein